MVRAPNREAWECEKSENSKSAEDVKDRGVTEQKDAASAHNLARGFKAQTLETILKCTTP